MTTNTQSGNYFAKVSILFILFGLFFNTNIFAQANSIKSGVTFNWADTQSNDDDPATIESIDINGASYTTFVVPSTYNLISVGPGGHNKNGIRRNGLQVLNTSGNLAWTTEALKAYQSLNLNYYFESSNNGDDICNDLIAIKTSDTQIQEITYNPSIPSNPDGIIAITERGGNNCLYVELYGIPESGGPEQLLGRTFIQSQGNLIGNQPQTPPLTGSDYWSSGRKNDKSNQTIGIALYELSDLAPLRSNITKIRYSGATNDHGDGKFFLMQTYAEDDYFNPEFEKVFNEDAGANDNVPVGSTYSLFNNTQPSNGSVVVNIDGTFSYTPNPGFTGTDSFEVEVCLPAPNQSVCDTATVFLNIKSTASINDTYAIEGNNLVYTISLDGTNSQDIQFDISYTNISTISSDYSGPTTVTLPANSSSVSFNVLANDDSLIEVTEAFTVTITDPKNSITISDSQGSGEIRDNDAVTGTGIAFDNDNITVDEAAGTATVNVVLTGNVPGGFTLDFASTDDSAIEPGDYIANNNQLIFNGTNGESIPVTFTINDDNLIEPTERFFVNLSNLSTTLISINDNQATINITDNDSNNRNTEGIAVSDFTVNEDAGTAQFAISYSGNTIITAFNVNFTVTDNTAISPDDYTVATTGTFVTFPANTTTGATHIVTITIVDDEISEQAETLNISLTFDDTSPVGLNILDDTGVGIITDNDISVGDYTEELSIICGEDIPETPELTFTGGCGDYAVDFSEEKQNATDGSEDYLLIRTWNVTDACGNTASFEQIIFVFQPQLEEVTIDVCIEDEPLDLISFLPASFDTNGTFEVLEGNVVLNGSIFDPIDHSAGEYKIAYSSIDGECKYFVDFTIIVNTDCVPCGRGEIEISEAVTANGDGINDVFEIKGVEFCQFTFDVEFYNRWGDKVYESKDYRNDWNGSSPSGSVGSSNELPSGTYYYIITATDNKLGVTLKPFNGYIYLGTN